MLVDGPEQAMAVANAIAAEHLELLNDDPESLVPLVRNAGAVFSARGPRPASGDYIAGPNHVLPTARSARFGSALRVDDFRKHIHVVDVDRDGAGAAGAARRGPGRRRRAWPPTPTRSGSGWIRAEP